ncbi:MAG: hypothetical protein SGPRY_008012, partial [Prymnesium sp.]
MSTRRIQQLLGSLCALPLSEAHAALITPPSRNAIDRLLPPFTRGRSLSNSCNCADSKKGCREGVRASGGGQACLWFSQGCTIGCDQCTGEGSHTTGSLCASSVQPTLPKYAWTMNRWAEEGSVNDSYRYNPWRRPGSAPVFDACGKAGGTYPRYFGPGVAVFANTTCAHRTPQSFTPLYTFTPLQYAFHLLCTPLKFSQARPLRFHGAS